MQIGLKALKLLPCWVSLLLFQLAPNLPSRSLPSPRRCSFVGEPVKLALMAPGPADSAPGARGLLETPRFAKKLLLRLIDSGLPDGLPACRTALLLPLLVPNGGIRTVLLPATMSSTINPGSFDASLDSRGDMLLLTPPAAAAAAAAAGGGPPLLALFSGLEGLLPGDPTAAAAIIADLMLPNVAAAAADFLGGLPTLRLMLPPILLAAGATGEPPKVAMLRVGLPGAAGMRVPPGSGLARPLLQREKLL